jgi:epoxide hydrolase-like predicted phosphatase
MWPKRKPIKALLFDVGGVIVKTQIQGFLQVGSLLFGCTEKVLETHIAALVRELERGEIDSYALWEELGESLALRGEGTPQEPEKIELLWTQTLEGALEIDPDMLRLCESLQGVLPMGVLSNTIADHANHLRRLGVYETFNPCILSYEVGMRKPEERIYKLASALINTPPENCLFIDDLEVNIKAARQARMQTHLFTDRPNLEKRLDELGVLSRSSTG